MPADATQNSRVLWDYVRTGKSIVDVGAAAQVPPPHQVLRAPNRELQLRSAEPEPLPHYLPEEPEPEAVRDLNWDYLLKIDWAKELEVYSDFRTRSGYRKVMGKSGSRRRKAAKVGAVAGVAAAAVVAGATVASGILVVAAIL